MVLGFYNLLLHVFDMVEYNHLEYSHAIDYMLNAPLEEGIYHLIMHPLMMTFWATSFFLIPVLSRYYKHKKI